MNVKKAVNKLKPKIRKSKTADQKFRSKVAFWMIVAVWVLLGLYIICFNPKPPKENFWRQQFKAPVKELPVVLEVDAETSRKLNEFGLRERKLNALREQLKKEAEGRANDFH